MRYCLVFYIIFWSSVLSIQAENLYNFNNPTEILLFLQKILPTNPVILEAGAHYGEDTLRIKEIWPHGIQYNFEPLPTSYEKLQERTVALSNCYNFPYALSSYTGATHFYRNRDNDGASSIGYGVEWNKYEFSPRPLTVDCITLDEWAEKNNIKNIDFMWLDMEGHELYALQHGITVLSSVKAIYTEIGLVPIRKNSCLYKDYRAFLESQGFVELWQTTYHGKFGEALFIKKQFVQDLYDRTKTTLSMLKRLKTKLSKHQTI